MDFVKFGIIGCGSAAQFHVTAFRSNPSSKLKFISAYDTNEQRLEKFSKYQKLTPYNDLDAFLQSDIEAVLIMVPHFLHAQITKAVAEAGKHVLCEKPMAPTLEECDEMISVTKNAGVKFMIAENHRFLPAHLLMKDLINRDFIGDVFLGRTYEGALVDYQEFLDPNIWHFTYDKGGGGVIADQCPHKFALLNWLLDSQVDSAQAWCGKALNSPSNKGEDNAIVFLHYKSGAMVEVAVSSLSLHPPTNRTELHGTKGTILEDHSWENPVQVFSSHKEAEKKGVFYSPSVEHGLFPKYYLISAHVEDEYFAECILEDKEPEFTPEHAREAIAVVLLSYLSAKKGSIATMDELNNIYETKGTKSILEDLDEIMQKNYENLKWK